MTSKINFPSNYIFSYIRLFRLNQPIGIWLLLWPVLISLTVASKGSPELYHVVLFTIGCISARSAGCAINDLCDKDIDPRVKRTQSRPLADKSLTTKNAIFAFVGMMIVSLIVVIFLGKVAFFISLICALLIAIYPLSKRFFSHPQLVLGVTYSLGIPMAWYIANENVIYYEWLPLFLANIVWVYAYDTIYAMADKPDDLKLSIYSSAITWGSKDSLITSLCFTIVSVALFIFIWINQLYWIPFISIFFICLGFIWQLLYIRERSIVRCITAFRINHKLQLLLLLAIVINYNWKLW